MFMTETSTKRRPALPRRAAGASGGRYARFMQADPLGYDDGMNMYAYVGGDPVNYTDPTGLERGRPRQPICTGTRIAAGCGAGGLATGLSGTSTGGVGGRVGGSVGNVGAGEGGYVCVKNCAEAGFTPGTGDNLGTFTARAGSYEWVSSGLGFYLSDGRYLLNPHFRKSPYSDAFDAAFVVGPPLAAAAAMTPAVAVSARAAAMNPTNRLFARQTGILNRNNVVRLGQGWKGSAEQGQRVFRLSIGHRSWPTIPGLPSFPWHLP